MAVDISSIRAGNVPVHKWGDRIVFGRTGTAGPFQGRGWSEQPDEHSCWTNGPEAELVFRTVAPPADILLSLQVAPFLPAGAIQRQDVTVFFNYFRVDFLEVGAPGEHAIYLPRELFTLRTARLRFHIPNCRSPKELGLNQDVRRLGLAFESVTLKPVP
jgi:hypothetical protein